MVNLIPKKQRDKDEIIRICGEEVGPLYSITEREIALKIDRFVKDRPNLKLSPEQLRKAYAYALTLCPAVYINPDTLDWADIKPPSEAVMNQAVQQAVRKVSITEPSASPL